MIEDDRQQKVVRHLETHEPSVSRHQVFVGTRTSLGRLVPLGEDTEPFADQVAAGWAADTARKLALTAR